MKFPFFKTLALAGAMVLAFGCGNDTAVSYQPPVYADFIVTNNCYWLPADQNYLIYIDAETGAGTVTNQNGETIGRYENGMIIGNDESVVYEGIDLNTLQVLTPEIVENAKNPASGDEGNDVDSNENDDDENSDFDDEYDDDSDNSGNNNHRPINSSNSQSSNSGPAESGNVDASGYPVMNYEKLTANGPGVTRGFATRYWDACKPHCSWPEKVNQNANPYRIARNCNISGEEIPAFTKSDDGTWLQGTKSSCDGGNAYTCIDMIPVAINDTLAYAFGAAPGADEKSTCGKCYQIQFTGEGKYGDKPAHKLLMRKTLIIMSSNVGYDVSGGQFDIMIPGGGAGAFDALSKQLGLTDKSLMGETYGGLYTTCENRLGADASVSEYKSCVTNMCSNLFSNNPTLLKGCMWFVDWYETANNPITLYKQVECPQYLVDKFTSTIHTSPDLNSAPAHSSQY